MKQDVNLMFELGTLRYVDRTWRQFLTPDFANLSEHMFRVAWIALILAAREGNTNHEKILKMALVHDVSESRTGDLNGLNKAYATRDESKAIKDILGQTSLADEMTQLWHESEERKTPEAQIVKDADYLDQMMELKEQEARGNTLYPVMKDIWHEIYGKKLFTKTARSMLEDIKTAAPLDWYVKAREQ